MLLHRLINRLQAGIIARPRYVVYAALLLLFVSILLGLQVEFRTSRSELAPPDDPEQMRFDRLMAEFGGSQALIACVERSPGSGSVDPGDLRAVADDLAGLFRRLPEVEQVFHRVDTTWFVERGIHFASDEDLEEAVGILRALPCPVERLGTLDSLAAVHELLADTMASRLQEGGSADEASPEDARRLAGWMREERRFLESPDALAADLEDRHVMEVLATLRGVDPEDGYLATRDGSILFLMISPASRDDSLPTRRAFVDSMRRHAESLLHSRPGYRIAFTGEPARVVEEMDIVSRDTWRTSIVAIIGVTLLTVLVFRWKSHSWLVLATLGTGVIMALGAVRLELGYLNLITSSFLSTLVGVGVAYGIHPVSEYELQGAHTEDPVAAVLGSYRRTGAAVTVAAVTTSAAFFSVLLMQFRGFAELGLVAGVGVLLCLLSAMVLLPALLVLYGRFRGRKDRRARAGSVSAPVDRLWMERGSGLVCRFPRTVACLAVVVTAAAGWLATGIGFDTNILELLPGDAESVRYQKRMLMDAEFSSVFNMVVANDLDSLREAEDRASREPTVAGFESVLRFLPRRPADGYGAMNGLLAELDRIRLPERAARPGRQRLADSLERLQGVLEEAADSAFGAGLTDTAVALEEAIVETADTAALVRESAPDMEGRWIEAQDRILAWARNSLDDLRTAARSEPPGLDDLPAQVRDRFVTSSGRYLGILQPSGSVFEPEFLERYVQACRRISPAATGFPMVFHHMSGRITAGFQRAVVAGFVLVVLILLIDYRNPVQALLALVPLGVGVIWMLGAMRLLGLSFNFANLVAVPLIIGVGIDNGVHIIHRLRYEGRDGISLVLRHTGRAILIASMTTMIGFGSLAMASHRGLASLGTVLLLGVGSCLLSSMIVLPNLLVALRVVRK